MAAVVTRASRARRRSGTGRAGETVSYASTGISVRKGWPDSFATNMSTARSAPGFSRTPGLRTPRGRYPSASAGPSGPPDAHFYPQATLAVSADWSPQAQSAGGAALAPPERRGPGVLVGLPL